MSHPGRRRSVAPWLFGLAALLAVLFPVLVLATLLGDGLGTAVLVGLADLTAAVIAALAATVAAARRGVRSVRTAVLGHPDGRAGRVAEFHAARWSTARERFAALQREYAAFEADPRAVAARPALTDVSVPATARFVEAYGDAEFLLTDAEPAGPRREEFSVAVDRAVAAWHDAQQTADALAGASGAEQAASEPAGGHETRAVEPPRRAAGTPGAASGGSEYAEVADAVRRAAARGMRDLRDRMRA